MIRIGILGDIGSGKTYIAKKFGYPIFNADAEVAELYKKSRKCYIKLKKALPNYISSFPVKKKELIRAISSNSRNLKKIIKIIHPEIRLKMKNFLKKNKNKKCIILDIPLLLENKINKKNDVLIFVDAQKKEINKRLKKNRRNQIKILRKFQLPIEIKKKKADFIIKNNFKSKFIKKNVKITIRKILSNA